MQDFRYFLLRKGLKPASIELYIKLLLPLHDKPIPEIQDHIKHLAIKGRSFSHINNIIGALRQYGEFSGIEELAKLDFFPKQPTKLRATMTDKQIEDFLALPRPPKAEPYEYERWTLFFAILAYTGMRASECANLKWHDILIPQGKIAIQDSKTPSGIRFAPISTPLLGFISTFEKKYAVGHCGVSSAYIFGSRTLPNKVYRSGEWSACFHARRRRLGINTPNLSTHSLRHSFITRWISASVSLPTVMKAVGHTRPETTLGYTHLVTADVEKAMLSDPLNYKSLNFEQILDAIESIFNSTIKNFTQQISISYRRDATGLTIEVKKPANHVPDGVHD